MRHVTGTARIIALSLILSLGAGLPAGAETDGPDWIPAEITLPADKEVVMDRQIGSANRMYSFTTQENGDDLADTWRAALESGPFQVKPPAEGMDQRLIEFSGGRIQNGQISFVTSADTGITTVQFDASTME
jgi:hypothetical protein